MESRASSGDEAWELDSGIDARERTLTPLTQVVFKTSLNHLGIRVEFKKSFSQVGKVKHDEDI
jgi:hypothetical protein